MNAYSQDDRRVCKLPARYFLSDDYDASLLPLPFLGRELYRPSLSIGRLVVLYRAPGAPTWMRKELACNAGADRWIGVVNASGAIEYFAQAVDAAGNVATALDYGNPFALSRRG